MLKFNKSNWNANDLKISTATPWLPILSIHIGRLSFKSKQDKVKVTNLKKKFGIVQKSEHVTHHMKLLNQMYKYEMDTASSVENTEQIWFHRQMDGRMDRRMGWQYSPLSTSLEWGYNYRVLH